MICNHKPTYSHDFVELFFLLMIYTVRTVTWFDEKKALVETGDFLNSIFPLVILSVEKTVAFTKFLPSMRVKFPNVHSTLLCTS